MLHKKSGRLRDGLTDIKYMKKFVQGCYCSYSSGSAMSMRR